MQVCYEIYLVGTTKTAQEMMASLARVGKKASQQIAEKKAANELVETVEETDCTNRKHTRYC